MKCPLTAKEQLVALEILSGYSNSEIAERLQLSTKTVEAHRFNIYGKLNIGSARELLLETVKRRWVLPRCIPHVQHEQITKLTHRTIVCPQLIETILSKRQLQLFLGTIQGLSIAEIARDLNIGVKTAYVHIDLVHKKLGLKSSLAIALLALRIGLIPGMEEFKERRRLTPQEFAAILPE